MESDTARQKAKIEVYMNGVVGIVVIEQKKKTVRQAQEQ